MIPLWHLITSLILSFLLYPYFGFASILVLLSGWLIDADHALYYIFKFKDFSYKRMYSYFKERKFRKKVINIFHTIEFYVIIFVLAFYNIYFLIIAIGLLLHVTMDIIYFFYLGRFDLRYWTLTGWIKDIIGSK